MKKIEAIIRNEKLGEVKAALDLIRCPGMQVWEVLGHGKQKGVTEQFRGREFKVDLLPKTKLEIVAHDAQVKTIVDTIIKIANTNKMGDGKIFISAVENVIRIRTGETGEIAVD